MKKVLILFAHPALQNSRVNREIVPQLKKLPSVTLNDLYQKYPEFDIDIKAEQELLLNHDVIVYHHPFYWYSAPSILKEWQDLVLEHGWAYGSQGGTLEGKLFFNIITTGGRGEAYTKDGFNQHTIGMLLAPVTQSVKLCKMIALPPYVIHGTHSIKPAEIKNHINNLSALIRIIQTEDLDIDRLQKSEYLNSWMENSNA